ncbi:hypothetical protein GIB67_007830 [Kingdonia uniflora]|uniref:Splicing factor Cactin n=1 Tax=Kingdonia uniflora TaxID=39325 RepID=A0A7J7N1X2_9MAGN|nr:hypothetical protein GIB67_007830 [Kingdonia uniflora]
MKPIDVLSEYLSASDDIDIETDEPYMVFKGLAVKEMEELRDDIKMHMDLVRATPVHIEFCEALLVISDWELSEAHKTVVLDQVRVCEEEPPAAARGVHVSIELDVHNLLKKQTYDELVTSQSAIKSAMSTGQTKNVEYWMDILDLLQIYKAKEIHAKIMGVFDFRPFCSEPINEESPELEVEETGSFSPKLLPGEENEEEAIEAEVDRAVLVYGWHNKYRPRKPKYFNRVHTGYEWNKYNQNHYDHDNPPPKFVQGYKFNIFYPDLVDKAKCPEYTLEKDWSNGDTCIIRFHAGPLMKT